MGYGLERATDGVHDGRCLFLMFRLVIGDEVVDANLYLVAAV